MTSTDETALLKAIAAFPHEDAPRLMYADWLRESGAEQKAHAVQHGVVKRYHADFQSPGGALTLSVSEVGCGRDVPGFQSRTHDDGWTITGEVHEDYYTWVNYFEATHPLLGLVWGDFEDLVFASSEDAFRNFYANHSPDAWDYHDI